jgi:hypothetical protein
MVERPLTGKSFARFLEHKYPLSDHLEDILPQLKALISIKNSFVRFVEVFEEQLGLLLGGTFGEENTEDE